MKRVHLLGHFCVPALFALVGFFFALQREPLGIGVLLAHLLGGLLFYAAPHLVRATVATAVRPKLVAWHAGFVVSSCALFFVGAMSVWGPRDSSGLPYHWLAYWPLAAVMLVVVVVGWLLAGRPHAGA